jgi:PII-like signaling protein
MQPRQAAKIMRLHLSEQDEHEGERLYEAIIEKCQELSLSGAMVFRGLEGYGESAAIHRQHLLGHDAPIVVTIIDSEEKIRRLLPILEQMMDTGLIAISDVEIARIRKHDDNLRQ